MSYNLLKSVDNLENCIVLDILNLSVNHISDLTSINRTIGNIRVLSLQRNNIQEIGSLDKLYSLEQLDLSHNQISGQRQVDRLGNLPMLEKLWLKGNPVSTHEHYRVQTLLSFTQRSNEVYFHYIMY